MPNSVTDIERAAFSDCTNLVEVSLPLSITTIKESLFRRCVSLKSIIIPSQVSSIGNAAFYNCSSLSNVTSLNTIPPILNEGTFTSYNAKLQVPQNSKAAYQNAPVWNNFANIVEIESAGIENIKNSQKREGLMYDFSGKRLANPQKGINIINGQKVIVK